MIVRPSNPQYQVRLINRKAAKGAVDRQQLGILPATTDIFDASKDVTFIQVNKTSREMLNTWTITLVPREDTDFDSYYERIEPMDYCEISAKRVGSTMKVLIRGFVTKILKQVDFSQGRPKRTIIITGENYGKLLRQSQIHYMLGLPPYKPNNPGQAQNTNLAAGTALQTDMPLLFGLGISMLESTGPDGIMSMLFNRLIVPNFNMVKKVILDRGKVDGKPDGELQAMSSDEIKDFKLDIDSDGVRSIRNDGYALGLIDPNVALADQTLYEAMKRYACLPFNEIFTDDRDDATYLVFRPTPWRDRDGKWVGPTNFGEKKDDAQPCTVYDKPQNDPNVVTIGSEDIIAYGFQRSDEEVFNYYFVDSVYQLIAEGFEGPATMRSINGDSNAGKDVRNMNPHFTMDATRLIGDKTTKQSEKLEFSRMELFGFRKLHQPVPYLSCAPNAELQKQYDAKGIKTDPSFFSMGEYLATNLFNAYEHNSALESGTVTVHGNEDIKPGMYVRFSHERSDSDVYWHYVTDVQHIIQPYESVYYTVIQVIRGERHLNKVLKGK